MSEIRVKLSRGEVISPLFCFIFNLCVIRNVILFLVINRGVCFAFLTAPESYEELKSLLSGKTVEEQLVVVEGIQTCNHPSLAVGNKAKLEVRAPCWECQGGPPPRLCVRGACASAPCGYERPVP